MALGTLLVVFALTMAQLNAGTDRDLPVSASKRLAATSSGKGAATVQPGAVRARAHGHGTGAIPSERGRPDS
jgi:hypothetical protein